VYRRCGMEVITIGNDEFSGGNLISVAVIMYLDEQYEKRT